MSFGLNNDDDDDLNELNGSTRKFGLKPNVSPFGLLSYENYYFELRKSKLKVWMDLSM